MAERPLKSGQPRGNLPPLRLHVPEPKFRPGDPVDYSDLVIPPAGAQPRPDETCPPSETYPLCTDLVRVLDGDDRAVGPWDPKLDPETLRRMLRVMALTRAFDDRMYRAQRQGKTSFYMKCTGEEAVAVAAAFALASDDMVFSSYRQQGILVARGFPLVEMVNQIYSNRADRLKGRQMPVMYSARDCSVFSISGNLCTQYPQAVGWAMASAIKGDSRIAATWIGEGSSAEGDFHSGLTFGAVYNAPVIFNVVNNQWAISSFSGIAGAERTTFAARAIGYGVAGLRVDGNDALAVYAATQWAANRARANTYRSAQEREEWPLGDPITRLRDHLIAIGEWSIERHETMDREVAEEVKAASKEAEKSGILGHGLHHPFKTMFEDVFEELPWHLEEQAEQAIRERRLKWPDWKES
jgi:2-oxoisovalerate dehydrogenase E1 component alpha subunit